MLPLFLQGREIIFIALAILVLFGGRKIPELMKGIGKGIRSFKDGINGIDDDLKTPGTKGEIPSDTSK